MQALRLPTFEETTVKRVDRISAAVILVFALWTAFESIRLGLVVNERPGSGMFPGLCSVLMILFAAIQVSGVGASQVEPPEWPRGENLRKVLTYCGAVLAFVLLDEPLGFLPSGVLFLALLLWYPGRYRWPVILAISVPIPLAVYLGLTIFLGAPLPPGILAAVGL